MLDPRVTALSQLLCQHSTRLTAEDTVLIHVMDIPDECTAELIRVAQSTGAKVMLRTELSRSMRQLMLGMTEANAQIIADADLHEMKKATAYIALRGSHNVYGQADVPAEIKGMWGKVHGTPVHMEQRVPHTKWVVLRWPTPSMAQQAGMSTPAFEDFYFKVCTVDYKKMAEAVKPLEDLMNRTDMVHIKGPGTDLTFSIKGVGAVPCCGEANIPDGECFTAPVKDSVNGVVQYNTTSLYQGQDFSNIRYVVKNGRIEEAEAGGQTARLNEILDSDEGGRYFGEWAIGFNPDILHPMKDTLFDEKIAGSFHLTPGNSYPPPGGNGNVSSIHWDTVLIQRPDYGGGEIWFDGVLIRKDGLFTLPELAGLNPENLKG
jgi:aminopeptidase